MVGAVGHRTSDGPIAWSTSPAAGYLMQPHVSMAYAARVFGQLGARGARITNPSDPLGLSNRRGQLWDIRGCEATGVYQHLLLFYETLMH